MKTIVELIVYLTIVFIFIHHMDIITIVTLIWPTVQPIVTTVIPSGVTAFISYYFVSKKAKVKMSEKIADNQNELMLILTKSQANMREELKREWDDCRRQNQILTDQVRELTERLMISDRTITNLHNQIAALELHLINYRLENDTLKRNNSHNNPN